MRVVLHLHNLVCCRATQRPAAQTGTGADVVERTQAGLTSLMLNEEFFSVTEGELEDDWREQVEVPDIMV